MNTGERGLRHITSRGIAFPENGQSVYKKRPHQKRRHYKELGVESIMPKVINYRENWNLYIEGMLEGRTPKEIMKYVSMRYIGRPREEVAGHVRAEQV
jgi:hypothetical protein